MTPTATGRRWTPGACTELERLGMRSDLALRTASRRPRAARPAPSPRRGPPPRPPPGLTARRRRRRRRAGVSRARGPRGDPAVLLAPRARGDAVVGHASRRARAARLRLARAARPRRLPPASSSPAPSRVLAARAFARLLAARTAARLLPAPPPAAPRPAPGASPESLLSLLGLTTFRPGQREAIVAALEGRDVLWSCRPAAARASATSCPRSLTAG